MAKKIKMKSTTKYRKFNASPLIPVIAIIEVIVLIATCTYSWFVFSANKTAEGVITVNADSGLDIDFKNANTSDKINIWDYVDPETFKFEPCTSLDGRNIYFPTSGTFNNTYDSSSDGTDASRIKLRDATINDINSKYLNVDFELSNTSDQEMQVYLSDDSYFRVDDGTNQTDSRALRLAFYCNDGTNGNVSPSLLKNSDSSGDDGSQRTQNTATVYFQTENSLYANGAYAYLYSTNGQGTQEYLKAWPGTSMSKMYGTSDGKSTHSYTFENPRYDSNNDGEITTDDAFVYDKIIFNNGKNSTEQGAVQTNTYNFVNGNVYNSSSSEGYSGQPFSTKKVYFLKPDDWDNLQCSLLQGNTELANGQKMEYVSGGVYSITVQSDIDKFYFYNYGGSGTTSNINLSDNEIAFFSPDNDGTCKIQNFELVNIYFYNAQGFTTPYAMMKSVANKGYNFAMSNLTGNVYYATIPNIYTGTLTTSRTTYNSSCYFSDNRSSDNYKRTRTQFPITAGNIYYCTDQIYVEDGISTYECTQDSYDVYTKGGSYAVISPGISAGFQRSYTPVVKIDNNSGSIQTTVPAFASSIDNYIYGSKNPMFTLESGKKMTLSMIIWLEGTDPDCNVAQYAGNKINLYLKFATILANEGVKAQYKYKFYDSTKEVWTSDKVTNEAGVSVSPVMQLYDTEKKRGYLMTPASYTNGKVDVWECTAPQSLVNEDGHNLEFRRVNPYNEEEVWNKWQAGTCRYNGSVMSDAMSTLGDDTVISYSAFSDGSPLTQSAISGGAPEKSCGGLWGQHSSKFLTVSDGTVGEILRNSDIQGTSGLVTINYTYKYNCGATQTIEYKASATNYQSLYVFVIPENIYQKNTFLQSNNIKFTHYKNFDFRYACNSEKNSRITYDKSWTISCPSTNGNSTTHDNTYNGIPSKYAYINEQYNQAKTNNSYWGQDLYYIHISNTDDKEHANIFKDNAKMRIDFWDTDTTFAYLSTSLQDFTATNYDTYCMVIPIANKNKNVRFKLHRMGSDGTTHWTWQADPDTNYITDQNVLWYDYFNNDGIHWNQSTDSSLPGELNGYWPW